MDPIANMFSQILNAQKSAKKELVISYSQVRAAILTILKTNHYIDDFKEQKADKFIQIQIILNNRGLGQIRRISRPGRRFYSASKQIPRPKGARGMVIVSTSKGLMNGEEARRRGLGGEIMAEIIK